jgi:aromatic-L-amino-acid decarboxylase
MHPLEISGESFLRMADTAARQIAAFLDTLPEQPASNYDEAERRARLIVEPLPQVGQPFEQLLTRLLEEVFPVGLNTPSPGYLAYIPGGGLPHAAVADLISLALNRYVGLWAAAPAVAQLEATVVRWLCDIAGYGGQSGGFLTSGGSLANWAALVIARELKARDTFRSAVVYTSNQAHHSVAKAVHLAGIPREQLRSIDVDESFRIRVPALRSQIAVDRRQGLIPLAIVAHAGTTNTGAVDDLAELADLAEAERLWLHVDAAYGGFFLLTERGRAALQGIAQADSITLDPHKGLFLPYGTGCLLARRNQDLKDTFAGRGAYMNVTAHEDFVDFCDISPELSRDFRGLRLWLPLKMHGIEPFRQCLDEKLDLARHAAKRLRAIRGINVLAEPDLSIVAFQRVAPAASMDDQNRMNRDLLERVNSSRRVWLSSTILREQVVLRLCIFSFRTHQDRVDECIELIRQTVES